MTSTTIPQGQFIAGSWQAPTHSAEQPWFCASNAATGADLAPAFASASMLQLHQAATSAQNAALWYQQQTPTLRAQVLEAIADELTLCPALLPRMQAETGLTLARLQAELQRTTTQLRAFATHLRLPIEPRSTTETASTAALWHLDWPLGPVVVFAASNFPLAFSVAGGDTAAALAAGCPVLVKAHPAHPGGSALAMQAIERALQRLAVPVPLVQLLQSEEPAFSHALVQHPAIAAVSFTGSKTVGLALEALCQQRDVPIPFFGELGAVNPQLLLEQLDASRVQPLVDLAITAITGSGGQLCTKPGVWLVPANAVGDLFIDKLSQAIAAAPAQTLLGPSYLKRYQASCQQRLMHSPLMAQGTLAEHQAPARLWCCDADDVLRGEDDWWQQEIFGPCAQVIRYRDAAQLRQLLAQLPGQLAVSVHGELQQARSVLPALAALCGRLLLNQLPTGVAVHPLMMHGGPYPASTNAQHSAVGLSAMQRFVRPLCLQAATLQQARELAKLLQTSELQP